MTELLKNLIEAGTSWPEEIERLSCPNEREKGVHDLRCAAEQALPVIEHVSTYTDFLRMIATDPKKNHFIGALSIPKYDVFLCKVA
jgi:hypothetical protein